VIKRRAVLALGLSQLISWGVTYYLIGGFGEEISADLHWTRNTVYGGFSVSLLVMGVTSPIAGSWIDRYGGPAVMNLGSLVNAAGCVGLASSHTLKMYFLSWIILGFGMRLTLYDAAFATLARLGGPYARGAMSQITLLGGLAATVFWPLGHLISSQVGWRVALLVYAGLAVATIPMHFLIPKTRYLNQLGPDTSATRASAVTKRQILRGSGLYAIITTGTNFLNAGMSAHMVAILTGLGLSASAAIWIATLRGVGQSAARLCEILFGRRVDPIALNLLACAIMPISFILGLFSGYSAVVGLAFVFLYGACNGVLTITRGTLPLVLFGHRSYGRLVGALIVPSLIVSAAAPVIYSLIMGWLGEAGALRLSVGVALTTFLASFWLKLIFPDVVIEGPTDPTT
jgi:predicted MFS family arabinose efflux permease